MTSIVPSIAGWRTYSRALINLLLFGLTALVGEWLVHQIEYLIEYGSRFGSVMTAGPHHYMAPLGIVLGVAGVGALGTTWMLLHRARRASRVLLAAVPRRLALRAPLLSGSAHIELLGRTAVALTALQALLYLVQENVESAAASQGLPGLWIFVAAPHITVLPLHLIVATCGALVLRSLSSLLQRSRQAVCVARILAAIATAMTRAMPRERRSWRHLPALRLETGAVGLRAPPRAI